ncbi:hypothetical protein AVEN_43408-1 [Araneus ventricosus]|uniref:Uncharacterized protein n=1 Tax=Araneus ventricosus TaxID=182803 RepID=A0A4Y2VU61_ARAVE|nr:hypothetical protein AVEN_43408-1 [Araneus ventricosus]
MVPSGSVAGTLPLGHRGHNERFSKYPDVPNDLMSEYPFRALYKPSRPNLPYWFYGINRPDRLRAPYKLSCPSLPYFVYDKNRPGCLRALYKPSRPSLPYWVYGINSPNRLRALCKPSSPSLPVG